MSSIEQCRVRVNHKIDILWFIFSASFHHPEVFRWVLHRSCPSIHLDSQQGLAPTWVPLQVLPFSQPPPLPELEESHREDGTGWLPASTQTAVDRLRQALLARLLGSGLRARTGWEVKWSLSRACSKAEIWGSSQMVPFFPKWGNSLAIIVNSTSSEEGNYKLVNRCNYSEVDKFTPPFCSCLIAFTGLLFNEKFCEAAY